MIVCNLSQVLLCLAVGATSIALILSSNNSGINAEEYVPHTHHQQPQQPQNFIMREGLPAAPKPKQGGGASLGKKLKDKGWVVVFADWCGFCKRQQAMFDAHPEHELDILIVKEDDMTDGQKALNEGFPAWINEGMGKKSPGFKPEIVMIEELLNMD